MDIAIMPLRRYIIEGQEHEISDGFKISSSSELRDVVRRVVTDQFAEFFDHIARSQLQACKYCLTWEPGENVAAVTDESVLRSFGRILQIMRIVKPTPVATELLILADRNGTADLRAERVIRCETRIPASDEIPVPEWNERDVETLKSYWQQAKKAYSRHQGPGFDALANAINFHEFAWRAEDPWVRFMNFAISLESIYTWSFSKISYFLSKALAGFLARSNKERQEYYKNAERIYEIRSCIAHGKGLPSNILCDGVDWGKKVQELSRITLGRILGNSKYANILAGGGKIPRRFFNAMGRWP